MPLVTLQLPPGLYSQGTQYQSKGRWRSGSLIRWRDGAMQPVGGWSQFQSGTFTGIARGATTWTDNSNNRWLIFGTAAKAYVMDDDGAITDITPAGFVTGNVSATQQGGYGEGTYGSATYGTPRSDIGAIAPATTWSWDTFGELPIGCSDADGKIYEWDLNTSNALAAVSNAPTDNIAALVTAERFILALGAGGDPRKVQWCDREQRTSWTPSAANQAGAWTLDTDGKIMFGAKGRGESLIVTTTSAHRVSYIGYPYVHSFDRVGTGCGAVSRKGFAEVDGRVFWMGEEGFFLYDGGYVQRIPCTVWDAIRDDIDVTQVTKVTAFHNDQFNEVWWLYPDSTSQEVSKYISFNYAESYWSLGSVPASTVAGSGTFNTPLGLHTDQKVYEHEVGYTHGTYTPFCESGPIEIGDGERFVHATRLIPDEDELASTTLTFKVRTHPTGASTSYGPFTMTEPTSLRFSGRQLVMRVEPSATTDWRFGVPRLEVVAGGTR